MEAAGGKWEGEEAEIFSITIKNIYIKICRTMDETRKYPFEVAQDQKDKYCMYIHSRA